MIKLRSFLAFSFFIVTTLAVSNASHAEPAGKKIGLLFGSYGDVDQLSEVQELVLNTVQDPDVVPLPWFLRHIFAHIGWWQDKEGVLSEYEAIGGGTGLRANSQAQADLAAQYLRNLGYDATGYTGFTMTFPYVEDTLDQVRADGVEELIVFYQGAQYSQVTAYIVFRDVEKYLDQHPDWDVTVTGVKSFSDDPRFTDLIIERIDNRMETDFPDADDGDICVFLPAHGNIYRWLDRGDPSYDQMLRAFETLSNAFPDSHVSYGFQNHDEMPLSKWTQPVAEDALDVVAEQPCQNVIINGMVSFTVGSLETIYDHGVAEVEYLTEQSALNGSTKQIVVEGVFDDDPDFAAFMGQLAAEALEGRGDITPIGNGAVKALSLK